MNNKSKISDIFFKIIFGVLFAIVLNAFTFDLYSADLFNKWGISREAATKKFIRSNEATTVFTPVKNPDYENKIMNMVKLILRNVDADTDKNITVVTTKTNPRKDFLFFKNKLFSVLEAYNTISRDELKTVIKKLTAQYGEPNYNPGSEMEIYFISTKVTKIIVHYYLTSKRCEIYYYDSLLYHKLSANDF
ncbi:MAG: hypothetical protein JXN64_13930 [Spirochaetes bacterium]|nr:hypothetical protein [Spirochaetota bacterium]